MKFQTYIVFFLLLVGVSPKLIAIENSKTDSLLQITCSDVNDTTIVNAFTGLTKLMGRAFPDSAITFAKRGLVIAKKINYKIGEANLYKELGDINWSRGQIDQAEIDFTNALEIYNILSVSIENKIALNSKIGIGFCYKGIGIVWYLRGNYSEALKYFQLSLNSHEAVNFKPGIAKGYNNIGLVHWKQNNLERAIEYFNKALGIYNEIDYSRDMGGCYNNIAIIYKQQEKYEEALKYYNKSLDILLKLNDKKGIALCYNNIGMLYEKINNFKLALDYYQKSVDLKLQIDDQQAIPSSYNNLASVNNKIAERTSDKTERIRKYNQAIEYAEKGMKIAKEVGVLNQEMDIYEILSVSYEGLGQFDKSLAYYKLRTEIKDSLFNQSKNKQIEEAEAKFQSAQKQQEIDKQKTELEKQKIFRNSLIIFSILIILLVILIYNRYILKQKTNRILEEKNKELLKLSIVASETDNAVTICDAEGNFEWVNEGLYELFGYTLEERKKVHGKNIYEASTNPKIKEIIENVKKNHKSVVYESTIETSNREVRNLQTTLTPFLNEKGEIQKLIFIDTDITDLKNAEKEILRKNREIIVQKEELEKHRNHLEKVVDQRTKDLQLAKEKAEESDRLKSSFLTNMSHEIRTPMNAIIGFSSLLGEDNLDQNEKNILISEISTHSYSLLNLIDNILELARIDTSQIKIQKSKLDLNNTMNKIFNSFYDIIKLKGLSLDLKIPKTKIEAFSDSYRINQVFNNLIDNAIKFTDKGQITIGYSTTKNTIEFFVKDTGIGLSEDQQIHIFNRFTKIEDDKKKLYRGAGLGLAICKNILKFLNGDIWVESEPGKGASFYFTIPYHIDDTKQILDKEYNEINQELYNWENKTILIAEDEESNFRYLEMLLKTTKAKIIHAENGKQAVEKSNNIDIILLDIKMPIMDGLEATKIIKQKHPNLPIISVSAYSSKEDIELSKKAGCEEHLAKPIQKTRLFEAIEKYLNKYN